MAISSCLRKETACRPTRCSLQSHDLQTDESLLTGESVPVRKIASGERRSVAELAGRAAMTCHMCFPARWSCAGQE